MKRTTAFFLILANVSVGLYLWFEWDYKQLLLTSTRTDPHVSFSKFEDLDGDGFKDEIHVIDYNNIYSIFGIRSDNGFVSDIKVKGKIKSRRAIYFHDIDLDGQKEIWSIVRYQDTLRLNLADQLAVKESHPITWIDPDFSLEFQDYFVEIIGFKNEHLFFAINSGYPLEPRAIYSFNNSTKEFNRSKDEGSLLLNPFFFDLDRDGDPEIIPRSFAPENIHYIVPYTDSSAWLRVFDLDLNHAFKPIEYKHNTSTIEVFPYVTDSANYLCVSHRYGGQKNVSHSVSLIDHTGQVVIKNESHNLRSLFEYDGQLYISDYSEPAIFKAKRDLQNGEKIIDLEEAFVPRVSKHFPITSKGNLFLSYSNDKVQVLSKDLSKVASYYFPDGIEDVSIKDARTLDVRSGGKGHTLTYAKQFNTTGWGVFGGVVLVQFLVAYSFLKVRKKSVLAESPIDQSTLDSRPMSTDNVEEDDDHIFISDKDQTLKVMFDDIEYLESAGDGQPYTKIHLTSLDFPFTVSENLGSIGKELPVRFFRVSRQSIVDLEKVIAVNSKTKELTLISKNQEIVIPASGNKISKIRNLIQGKLS